MLESRLPEELHVHPSRTYPSSEPSPPTRFRPGPYSDLKEKISGPNQLKLRPTRGGDEAVESQKLLAAKLLRRVREQVWVGSCERVLRFMGR